MKFEIVGDIEQVETIASGRGVKIRLHLQKVYGKGRWRKLKGVATFGCRTESFAKLSYMGTKLTESVGEISRSRRF